MRKKIKTEPIITNTPKKRITTLETKKGPIKSAEDTTNRWDRVKGVHGKIVRIQQGDTEKQIEMGNLIQKGKARRMYVGRDGDFLYFYYEIFKE